MRFPVALATAVPSASLEPLRRLGSHHSLGVSGSPPAAAERNLVVGIFQLIDDLHSNLEQWKGPKQRQQQCWNTVWHQSGESIHVHKHSIPEIFSLTLWHITICEIFSLQDLLLPEIFSFIMACCHSQDLLLLEIFSSIITACRRFPEISHHGTSPFARSSPPGDLLFNLSRDPLLPEIFSSTSWHVAICKIFSSQRSSL